MKKLPLFLLLIAASTLLTACKFNVVAAIHMSDIHKVAFEQRKNITTPTTLEIQIPSKSECGEYADSIVGFLERKVASVASRGCIKKGAEAYLLIEVKTPLVYGIHEWEEAVAPFGVMLVGTDGPISVYVMNNIAIYEDILDDIEDEFDFVPDHSNTTISIFLNNFRRHEYLLVRGVFVNGKPVEDPEEIEYRRRRRLSIGLSDVAISHLGKEGYALAFVLKDQ